MKSKPIRALAVGVVAAVAALGLFGCTPEPEDTGPNSVSIAVSPGFAFDTRWAHSTSWAFSLGLVYESLIIWNTDTNQYDDLLAESFDISDDGLTMAFTIRKGVTFADGTEMDADAVAKSINWVFAEGDLQYLVPDWAPVATVTGDDTVEVTAIKPITTESVLLLQFSTLAIVAPAAIDDPTTLEDRPNGTGPYLVTDVVLDTSISYERNPDYWNPNAVEFDEISVNVYADKTAALNALKSGQVDAAELTPSMAAEAEAGGLTIDTEPAGLDLLLLLDRIGSPSPELKDVRVRQALSYAIDRQAIVDSLLNGYGGTSTQPFDPASVEYVEGSDDTYAYDPDKARELLAEAGYPDGFTLTMGSTPYTTVDYTSAVAQYFAEVGVTVEFVDNTDFGVLTSGAIDTQVYNLPYSFTIGSYTDHNWWVAQPIDDPDHQEIIDRYTGDPAIHEQALEDYGQYIVDNAWYIVLAHPDAIWAYNSNIQVDIKGGVLGALSVRPSWFSAPE